MARLMVAAISALLFVTPGQQAPRPTEEALAKAETQTRQMYGVSIRKARKPADQAAPGAETGRGRAEH